MNPEIYLAVLTVVANALVTWGVIKTELRYLRRDVDAAHARLDALNAPAGWSLAPEKLAKKRYPRL